MAVQSFRVRKRKGICIIRIWGGLCLEWRSGDELVVTAVCGLSANQLLGSTVNHNLPALPFWMFPPGCFQWLHKNSLGILLDHLWTIYDNLILLDFLRKLKHWRQAMVLGWESSGYNYHDGWLDCRFLSRAYLSLVIFANSLVKPSGLFAYTLAQKENSQVTISFIFLVSFGRSGLCRSAGFHLYRSLQQWQRYQQETEWGRPSPSAAGLLQHFEGHCVSDKFLGGSCILCQLPGLFWQCRARQFRLSDYLLRQPYYFWIFSQEQTGQKTCEVILSVCTVLCVVY